MATTTAKVPPPNGLASVLRSAGPVVTCVLLSAPPVTSNDGDDKKKAESKQETPETKQDDDSPTPVVLSHLIREVSVDTTPSKNGVVDALGGPFTFLGQIPDQGCVAMTRKPPLEYSTCSLAQLRAQCLQANINIQGMVEKNELVEALEAQQQLPLNPHTLPPPLHKVKNVRGPILLLRVAGSSEDEEVVEEGDDEAAIMAKAVSEFERVSAISNDEFFLDYTKEEYIQFASRTDHVIPPSSSEGEEDDDNEEDEEDSESDDNGDEEEDEDFDPEECQDEEKKMFLNYILGEVLNKFREENGRGPDSEEVLELRKSVALKLGMELPPPPASEPEPEETKKRSSDDKSLKSRKKVKFGEDVESEKGVSSPTSGENGDDPTQETTDSGDEDGKPAAKNDNNEEPSS